MRLTVFLGDAGLVAVVADEPAGLNVMDHSLAQALERIPSALAELRAAGAVMPRLEVLNLP